MKISSYKTNSVAKFKGLWARGSKDDVPMDHAIECPNVWLNSPGEVASRYGSSVSFSYNHPVVEQFLATTSHGIHLLTMDNSGNIYKDVDPVPLVTVPGMVGFVGLNIFDKVVLNCIIDSFPGEPLKIWDGVNPVRNLAGLAPVASSAMVAADGAAGTVDIGVHQIAVAYLTQTDFITQPGPKISGVFTETSYNAPGAKKIDLSNIPIGPDGTIARYIIMTKGDELQFFFVPDGIIHDNTTTSFTIDAMDSQLVIDASYLFDLLETVSGGIFDGGLNKYHGRMLVWGGEIDLVRVSYSGDIESFDNVTGYIQLPSENDGNQVRGGFVLRDVVYFTKSVGILSTQDLNGDIPASWSVTYIDGSVGSFNSGVSTITSSQTGLPVDDILLLIDYSGLHFFNGVVQNPPLSWKIEDKWRQIDGTKFNQLRLTVDPFKRLIYILIPDGAPFNLLVADYSEGMTAKDIKWSHWSLPFVARSMSITNVQDVDSFGYFVRLGTLEDNNLYKLNPDLSQDLGTPIAAYYRLGFTPVDIGKYNIYRGLRFRANGTGTQLELSVFTQDDSATVNLLPLPLANSGTDLLRELNVMSEKLSVKFGNTHLPWKVNRVDILGSTKSGSRPA